MNSTAWFYKDWLKDLVIKVGQIGIVIRKWAILDKQLFFSPSFTYDQTIIFSDSHFWLGSVQWLLGNKESRNLQTKSLYHLPPEHGQQRNKIKRQILIDCNQLLLFSISFSFYSSNKFNSIRVSNKGSQIGIVMRTTL